MPDVNGQMQLTDFRSELKNRGFDGFTNADLDGLINRGYFYVARKTQSYWDMKDYSGVIPANGQLLVTDTGALPGFKTVEAVYVKKAGDYVRLDPVDDSVFRSQWLPDYQRGSTGYPSVYYIDGNTLWVLPKVSSVTGFTIELRYNSRPAAMTADTAVPITPIDLDEIILTAALVRAHKRANEIQLAVIAQADLDEAFDDVRDLLSVRSRDVQERVTPDNGWL
jgi:hypothetical protein